MPIEQILELIKDKPELAQEVKDAFDKAGALEKVKTANSDLTAQRTALENEKKDLKAQIASASKGDGTSNADLLALKEQLTALQGEIQAERDKASKATAEKRTTDLKNAIVSAAASKAVNPSQVVALMLAEGLAGHNEDGSPFYRRINDRGEQVTARNPDEAIASFLKANTHLEKSSGSTGSGQRPNATGTGGKFSPMDFLSKR